jgi:hypothetical protein
VGEVYQKVAEDLIIQRMENLNEELPLINGVLDKLKV